MMDVYILTNEPYRCNSTILGVFRTLEAAKAFQVPDTYTVGTDRFEWSDEGFYTQNWANCVAQSQHDALEEGAFLIYKMAVQ